MKKTVYAIAFLFAASLSGCGLLGGPDQDCIAIEPARDCVCIEIYDPVCGCNDVTYSNSCHAECAGITSYSEGACN